MAPRSTPSQAGEPRRKDDDEALPTSIMCEESKKGRSNDGRPCLLALLRSTSRVPTSPPNGRVQRQGISGEAWVNPRTGTQNFRKGGSRCRPCGNRQTVVVLPRNTSRSPSSPTVHTTVVVSITATSTRNFLPTECHKCSYDQRRDDAGRPQPPQPRWAPTTTRRQRRPPRQPSRPKVLR
jgi:hypothetical protein